MSTTSIQQQPWPSCVLYTLLPGPDRKRAEQTYCYRLTYRNSDEAGIGCLMIWEVSGGRLSYQIAIERDEQGGLHPHCTCADAVYRAEEEGRSCKHIRGLLAFASSGHALLEVSPQPVSLRLWPQHAAPDCRCPVTPPGPELGEVA